MIEGFDSNGQTGTFVMFVVVNFIGIIRAWGYPNANALDGWMTRHGLRIDSPSLSLLAAYLRRTRWIRTIGFLVGWNVPFVWLWVTRSTSRMSELLWSVVGFAIGIVVAELIRPRSDRVRSATLEPRRLSHYLPGFTRVDGWIVAGVVTLLAVLGIALPSEELRGSPENRASVAWYLALCVLAVGIIFGTRLMQEALVRRRQSFSSVDETRADDAMRSASIQSLAGVGYGGPTWIGAIMAWDLALSTDDPVSGLFDVFALILAIAGFAMLVGLPRLKSRWIVRRGGEA